MRLRRWTGLSFISHRTEGRLEDRECEEEGEWRGVRKLKESADEKVKSTRQKHLRLPKGWSERKSGPHHSASPVTRSIRPSIHPSKIDSCSLCPTIQQVTVLSVTLFSIKRKTHPTRPDRFALTSTLVCIFFAPLPHHTHWRKTHDSYQILIWWESNSGHIILASQMCWKKTNIYSSTSGDIFWFSWLKKKKVKDMIIYLFMHNLILGLLITKLPVNVL